MILEGGHRRQKFRKQYRLQEVQGKTKTASELVRVGVRALEDIPFHEA